MPLFEYAVDAPLTAPHFSNPKEAEMRALRRKVQVVIPPENFGVFDDDDEEEEEENEVRDSLRPISEMISLSQNV